MKRAPWRERTAVLALGSLSALWMSVRLGLLATAPALALGLLVATAWGLAAREPDAR